MPRVSSFPSWPPGDKAARKRTQPSRYCLYLEQLESRDLPALDLVSTGVSIPTTGATNPVPTEPAAAFANLPAGAWSPGYTWADVQVADINGDGLDDVVGRIKQTGQWWAAVSNGAGGFTNIPLTTWSPLVTWVDVKVGDFNGDGKADIVGRVLQTGEWWAVMSAGNTFVNQLLTTWSPAMTWVDVSFGDLTGDGLSDIVGRAQQTGQWFATVYAGGIWKTTLWDSWSPGLTWVDVKIGDLTGNGRADLVGRCLQTGQWYAAISTGASFSTQLWDTWSPGYTWVDVHLADMNGDGRADIVGRALQNGQWWVAASTGTSFTTSLWATWSPNVTWADVQVADFNGDGRMDIAGRVASTGQWWVGLSNGSSFSTSLWTTWSPNVTWINVHAAQLNSDSSADLVGMVAGSGQWWVAVSTAPVNPYDGFIGDQQLLQVAQTGMAQGNAMAKLQYGKQLTFDAAGRVSVNVRATLPEFVERMKANLQQLGMVVTSVNTRTSVVTGFLAPSLVDSLPTLEHFAAATVNHRPVLRTGAVTTQGDAVIKANTLRAATGLDGSGVTVGVISDSANQYAGGLADSQATGDLGPVTILQDGMPGDTDEGRAMLEIVHDVAPGAALQFHTSGMTGTEFANAINTLAAAGSKVITDDIGLADEPFYNDGLIAQAIDGVTANNVFYTTAAGNAGAQGFTANWQGVSGTVMGVTTTFFDFGGGNIFQPFTLQDGEEIHLSFQWDSAFLEGGSTLANYQVPNSLYAYVASPTGSVIYQSYNNINQNTAEAWQDIDFVNFGLGTTQFALVFQLVSGPAPSVIRWVGLGFGGTVDPMAVGEGSASIYGHSVATGAVVTGAVSYDRPSFTETYSALGGNMPILFDATGRRLPTPEFRQKPDLVAPDNVDTTFFIPGVDFEPDGFPNFTGTSAATPHVAGAAALERQDDPAATPDQIAAHFKATTLVIGTPGFDPSSGAGLLQVTALIPVARPPGVPQGPPNDQFEPNDTSDAATRFGVLVGSQSYVDLSINLHTVNGTLIYDQDWYRWQAGISGTFTSTLTSINPTTSGGDIHEKVFKLLGDGSLLQIGASTLIGGVSKQSVAVRVNVGDNLLVWVYGYKFALGTYDLNVSLT
jgi:hypothetical protein